MANKIDLKMLFNGLQSQMNAQLNTNRAFINHPGSKGDSLENAWIEWLRKYLPNRYSVDKAIVIDHEGNTSHQIDIVIYDNWFTPFIFLRMDSITFQLRVSMLFLRLSRILKEVWKERHSFNMLPKKLKV